jgi:hypothetical protein
MRKRESNFYLQFSLVPLFILLSNYGTVVSSPILSTIIFVVTLPPLTCFFIIPQQSLEKVVVRDTLKHGFFLLKGDSIVSPTIIVTKLFVQMLVTFFF